MKRAKAKLIFALLLPLAALVGCATTYQKEGVFANGYSDFRSSENTFVVTFRASEHTPAEKVFKHALKRCAELTRKHGFRYFTILEKKDLHFPSIRLSIQCYQEPPLEMEWIDAVQIKL